MLWCCEMHLMIVAPTGEAAVAGCLTLVVGSLLGRINLRPRSEAGVSTQLVPVGVTLDVLAYVALCC